jgi:hypothetical protein
LLFVRLVLASLLEVVGEDLLAEELEALAGYAFARV